MLRLLRHGWRFCNLDEYCAKDKPHLDPNPIYEAMIPAIDSSNVPAFLMLAELVAAIHICPHSLISQGTRPRSRHDLHIQIPSELFRRILRQPHASAGKLLQILTRLSLTSIPKDDPIITSWALQAREKKNSYDAELAGWILEYMEDDRLSLQEPLFNYGAWAGPEIDGIPPCPFDAVMFDRECGYNLSTFLFDDDRRFVWFIRDNDIV